MCIRHNWIKTGEKNMQVREFRVVPDLHCMDAKGGIKFSYPKPPDRPPWAHRSDFITNTRNLSTSPEKCRVKGREE